jgi:hypothetical protein
MAQLEELEEKRSELLEKFLSLGDLRRGTLTKRYLACGKGGCHCTQANSKGHGPKYSLTYKVKAKTKTEYIAFQDTGQVNEQLSEHRRFVELCQEFIEVSEEICRLRLSSRQGEKKKRESKK